MRHYVAVAAIALLLTGCSSTTQDGDGSAEQPESTTSTSDQSGTSGQSDYVSLELGDTAEFSAKADGTEPATWTIEKIEVDPPCEAQDGPRDSGHVLRLRVRVNTGPDKDAGELIPTLFRAESFAEPGGSGEPSPASAWLCGTTVPSNQPLPVPYQRNQELTGTVGLVVPEANGTLVQNDPLNEGEGWRWSYPTT